MRRIAVACSIASSLILATMLFAAPAGAYGGGADHEMWQVGISFNCNNPTVCGDELGGFWGWVEFDRAGTTTWGDAELTGCGHTIGGGGGGAGHLSVEIDSWTIAPGSAGPETFYVTGSETDFYPGGVKDTVPLVNFDTGIPAEPGHYDTTDIMGMSAPGVAMQIQVAYRPAK